MQQFQKCSGEADGDEGVPKAFPAMQLFRISHCRLFPEARHPEQTTAHLCFPLEVEVIATPEIAKQIEPQG